jgi:hypothetical protein
MKRLAPGLSLHFYQRHRQGLWILLLLLLGLAAIVHSPWKDAVGVPNIGAATGITLFCGILYFMGAAVNVDAEPASADSSYPSYLFLLPARTTDLVFWPMLFGAGSVAAVWILAVRLILIPLGLPSVFWWWPAALFAATVAALQAFFWSPFGLPYLRSVLASVLFPALIAFGLIGAESDVSPWIIGLAYLVLLPFAFVLAVAGLKLARRGDSPWRRRVTAKAATERAVTPPSPRFSSPQAAQDWLERRRNGVILPCCVFVCCAILTLAMLFFGDSRPQSLLQPSSLASPDEWGNLAPYAVVLFGFLIGGGLHRTEIRRKDLSLRPFYAVRPLSSAGMAAAMAMQALRSAAAGWGIVALFAGAWFLLPPPGGDSAAALKVLAGWASWKGVTAGLFLFALCVVWAWKNQINSMAIEYGGDSRIAAAFQGIVMLSFFFGLYGWALLLENPESLPRLLSRLPVLAEIALATKLTAGACVMRLLLRRGVLSASALARLCAAWLLMLLAFFGALRWLLPESVPSSYLWLGAALFPPLARAAAAPLAIDMNRHR